MYIQRYSIFGVIACASDHAEYGRLDLQVVVNLNITSTTVRVITVHKTLKGLQRFSNKI